MGTVLIGIVIWTWPPSTDYWKLLDPIGEDWVRLLLDTSIVASVGDYYRLGIPSIFPSIDSDIGTKNFLQEIIAKRC